MSEQQPQNHEMQSTPDSKVERLERHEDVKNVEKNTEKAPNKAEVEQTIERLKSAAKHEAISGKDVGVEKSAKNPRDNTAPFVNHELKQLMFKRTLTHVQKQLSGPARAFSKVTHSPVVETISNGAEKTVARSKGILVGSIIAFLGSAYSLYSAKYFGFSYNALVFLLLFVVGYLVTTLVELVVAKVRR